MKRFFCALLILLSVLFLSITYAEDVSEPPRVQYSETSVYKIEFPMETIELFEGMSSKPAPDVTLLSDRRQPAARFVWSTSDKNVAQVSASGRISAVSAGDAVIKCALKGDEDTYALLSVHVVTPVKRIDLSTSRSVLMLGAPTEGLDETDITVTFTPENAQFQNVTWFSLNEAVATVDENGHVTAHKPGSVTIQAQTTPECAEKVLKATIRLSVNKAVSDIHDENTLITVDAGKSHPLKPKIEPADAKKRTLNWSSSDENIATVSTDGRVRGVHRGECVITCVSADGSGASFSYSVTVRQPITSLTAVQREKRALADNLIKFTELMNIKPADASNTKLEWTIVDAKRFPCVNGEYTLLDDGIIFHNTGKYLLTGKTTDGSKFSANIYLTVDPADGMSLHFDDDSFAAWDCLPDNTLEIQFQLNNYSFGKTVAAFELYVLACDERGRNLYGNSVYPVITEETVRPGDNVYSSCVVLPQLDDICEVYCGVHRVLYTDGTMASTEDVDYWCWEID